MAKPKTPCIGICSTTSLGDFVCRGCKRYAFEVIQWNSYDSTEKLSVLSRIEKLTCQVLQDKFRIFSVLNLQAGLEQLAIPYDPSLSPYCWLHNLLKKGHPRIEHLDEYGVSIAGQYSHLPLADLAERVEQDLLELVDAHHARYYAAKVTADSA